MDIVYLVRPGDDNEELRYSLRSLVNLPHDRVWFVGHLPAWVRNVEHIPGNRYRAKSLNVIDNVRLACEHPDVDEDVVVMNDDFIILEPCDLAPWVRCSLAQHLDIVATRNDAWAQSLRNTMTWLTDYGVPEPRSFEMHTPFPIVKSKMAAALREVGDFGSPFVPQWRTVYGNLHVGEVDTRPDCKLKRHTDLGAALAQPLLSTTDTSFSRIGDDLSARFPDPSPYEM